MGETGRFQVIRCMAWLCTVSVLFNSLGIIFFGDGARNKSGKVPVKTDIRQVTSVPLSCALTHKGSYKNRWQIVTKIIV